MKPYSLIASAFARDISKSQLCADPDVNPDHVFCRDTVESIFSACIGTCDNDASCISACSRDYGNNYAKCPCMDGCPDGCPLCHIMVYGGHYNSEVDTDYAIQAERCSLIGDRVNCTPQPMIL